MVIELEEQEVLEILRNNPDAYIIYWQLIQMVDLKCACLIPIRLATFQRLKPFLKIDKSRNKILREYYVLNDNVD